MVTIQVERSEDSQWVYKIWLALIWGLGVVPIIGAITSPRFFNPDYIENIAAMASGDNSLSRWAGLGITIATLGLGIIAILFMLSRLDLRKRGFCLWLSALGLSAGTLISSIFGSHPDFSLVLLGLPIIFTALYMLEPIPLEWFVTQVKRVLLVYAYGSFLAAMVTPDWAVETAYNQGAITWFTIRLHGIATHANNLAPLLLGYLILDWFPLKRTILNRFNLVVVFTSLILTQSKTSWVLMILLYAFRLGYLVWSIKGIKRYVILSLIALFLIIGITFLYSGVIWFLGNNSFLDDSQQSFVTLTGRTQVWAQTVNLWEENPWFGYGPGLWNLDMRLQYANLLGWAPPHAHSQFYQTLGESGVIGIIGLVLYLLALLFYGIRYGDFTRGISLALVLVLLLRGITEPPLRSILSDGNFYLHTIIFGFLMLSAREAFQKRQAFAAKGTTIRLPYHFKFWHKRLYAAVGLFQPSKRGDNYA